MNKTTAHRATARVAPTIMLAAALTFFACSKEESCTLFGKCDGPEPSCVVGASGYAGQYTRFTDARDGKEYKSVVIGRQTWMAENLNYEAEGSKCYNNEPAKCEEYGRMYDWETALTACPLGWHLPTEEDFDIFIDNLAVYLIENGGDDEFNDVADGYLGKYLKSVSGWDNDCNGTDDFGFSALPGGRGDGIGIGGYGVWWYAKEYDFDPATRAYYYSMDDYDGELKYIDNGHTIIGPGSKSIPQSVRCIKD